MGERISREDDEEVNLPKIHVKLIRELYSLKERTGIPVTVLVDAAIEKF